MKDKQEIRVKHRTQCSVMKQYEVVQRDKYIKVLLEYIGGQLHSSNSWNYIALGYKIEN